MRHLPPLFQLILVSIAAHVALTGARITTALYALSFGSSAFTVGILIALFALFPMLFAVPMGRLIDRVGIKTPIVCGCLSMCIGSALAGAVGGLPVLYLATILIGTGFMTVHIGSQHAVGAMSSSERRSDNFSRLALGFSVSSFLGPVLAGLVIDHARHAIAYGVSFGFALLALCLIAWSSFDHFRPADGQSSRSQGGTLQLLRDPAMRRIYLIGILLAAAWDLFTFVTPIHGTSLGFSASTIGLILGSFALATFVIRLAMPWVSRRYTEWQILTAALTLAVLSYLLFPFMHHPLSLMAIAATLGVAVGASQPNVLSLLHHAAPAGRGGEALGIRATIGNSCQVFLPLAFGAAGATLGLFPVFWGVGAIIGSGLPMAWRQAAGPAAPLSSEKLKDE